MEQKAAICVPSEELQTETENPIANQVLAEYLTVEGTFLEESIEDQEQAEGRYRFIQLVGVKWKVEGDSDDPMGILIGKGHRPG